MNANGVTVVWASPGGDELVFASTVVYLEKGGILFAGTLERFYSFARENDRAHALPGIFQLGRKLVEIARGRDEDDEGGCDSAAANGSSPPGGAEPLGSLASSDGAPSGGAGVLAFRDVSFSYTEGTFAIERLQAALAPGECVGVTGPNGSGKTTLLELAGGILKPASGSVSVVRSPKNRARHLAGSEQRVDIFYLFQSPERMFFTETAFEEIAYGLKHLGVPSGDLLPRASQALRTAGLDPDVVLKRSPFRLSFGEMRRLALAIAVALRPRVLLVDEPSSCLDADGMAVLDAVLRSLAREGTAVLAASHDVDFLAELCGRILFLEHGAVACELALAGRALPQAMEWPGSEKPLVLELQDALAANGPCFEPRPLSPGGFVRAVIEHARTERNGTS
jgi:energy-coupling factor transport system ATP-binding protein